MESAEIAERAQRLVECAQRIAESAQRLRDMAARLRCLSCMYEPFCSVEPTLDCPHYKPLTSP